jgi:hypothetical protein
VALVVFLRGINVGGHRSFRPTVLAAQLKSLDVVSIGTAGTFVVRRPVSQARLRAEFARRLPFAAEIVVCRGQAIRRLVTRDFFVGRRISPDTVRFVSILSRRPRRQPSLPATRPGRGPWLLKVLATHDRFVIGLYRRRMRVIGWLGALDGMFGVPVTTRSWTTMVAVARVLDQPAA